MARKTQTMRTRPRLAAWLDQADELLAEISKAEAHNTRVRKVTR